ncbi:MAG: hypothetical protein DHS20C20_18790 [Ardenticatenaceae bacterium]|nr:MAG: hypothetical protein DHS20C20_18790 [Ardenticatenaceae bacterium]
MNQDRKQFLMWTAVAGILFLVVGIYDLFFLTTVNKSGFIILLEWLAGLGFLLNALLQWRKGR